MKFAKRLDKVKESATFKYAKLAKRKGIINLTIGRTNFDTPRVIKDAAKKALDEGKVYYTPSQGIPKLREKIAEKLRKENGINVGQENVLVSAGAKQIIFELIMALVDEGDEVAAANPSWVSYEAMVNLAGGKMIYLPLNREQGFLPGEDFFSKLENSPAKMIMLNSPLNPTGSVYPEKNLREICRIAEEKDAWIISDEIYEKIIYEGKHFSPGSVYPKTVTVNGFSKEFSMTGWRLGYCACEEKEIIEKINTIQQQTVSCAVSFVQHAALEAFNPEVKEEVKKMVSELKGRRDFVYEKIKKIYPGFKKPQGAFYAFPWIGGDDFQIVEKLLEKGVGVIPGSPFGSQGKGCIRISYGSAGIPELEKAMDILEENL